MKQLFGLIALILSSVLLLLSTGTVDAHTEGKMQLSAQSAGPFKMTVFTSPDPSVTGNVHVAALIFLADDASPVLDAEVLVTMVSTDSGGDSATVPATLGDAENKLLYEAIFDINDPGNYLVTVGVVSTGVGSGEASFELEILSSGGFNWFYLIPVIIIGLAIILFLLKRARKEQAR